MASGCYPFHRLLEIMVNNATHNIHRIQAWQPLITTTWSMVTHLRSIPILALATPRLDPLIVSIFTRCAAPSSTPDLSKRHTNKILTDGTHGYPIRWSTRHSNRHHHRLCEPTDTPVATNTRTERILPVIRNSSKTISCVPLYLAMPTLLLATQSQVS